MKSKCGPVWELCVLHYGITGGNSRDELRKWQRDERHFWGTQTKPGTDQRLSCIVAGLDNTEIWRHKPRRFWRERIKKRGPSWCAWYLRLRAAAGIPQRHCSPDRESEIPMWATQRYLNQNKHVQDNISRLAGCLLNANPQTLDPWGGSTETNLWHLCGTCGLFVDPKQTDFPPQGFICPDGAWHHVSCGEKRWSNGATGQCREPAD